MTTETNKALVRRWVEEAINKGNLDVLDETHGAEHVNHFTGFALPLTVVVMSGFAMENCSASFAMSVPLPAQCAAAARAAAFTASGSFSQAGRGAFVSRRAENGPALIAPTPLLFK